MAYGDCRIWWHCRGTTGRQRGLCAGFLGRDKRCFLSVVFILFFLDFFDTTGTLTGIADIAGKRRADGSMNLDRAVVADTGASVVGSLLGTSSMTTYLESATGIRWADAPG